MPENERPRFKLQLTCERCGKIQSLHVGNAQYCPEPLLLSARKAPVPAPPIRSDSTLSNPAAQPVTSGDQEPGGE